MSRQGKLFIWAAVVLGLIADLVFYNKQTVSFVGPITEDRVREWLSALSGYFALIAAVIGVRLTWGQLSEARRQTRSLIMESKDAERFHRQNAAISLRRSRTLAERVKRQATLLEEFALFSFAAWFERKQLGKTDDQFIKGVIDEYSILETYIDRADFLRVEDEIEAPGRFSHELLMRRIKNETKILQAWRDGGRPLSWENIVAWMTFLYNSSQEYGLFQRTACTNYLAETADIIGEHTRVKAHDSNSSDCEVEQETSPRTEDSRTVRL
jgi:hypothetical protein